MGFFSDLFGKKKEADESLTGLQGTPSEHPFPDENLGLDEDSNLGLTERPMAPGELPPDLTEHPAAPNMAKQQISSRDIDLISSKLDTLKAILNSMDQRIANLEKAAGVEQQKKMPW
ncbi:hypothetical protein ACFL0E_00195 [Nanoarchaeota archaeon]